MLPQYTVVSPGNVQNVRRRNARHVATGAVWIFRMVRLEFWLAVTGTAFCAEGCGPLVRIRIEVRIVTGSTCHSIAAHALTRALPKLFDLAYTSGGGVCVFPHIEGQVVRNGFARSIVKSGATRALDRDVALEVATETNRIAQPWFQTSRINNWGFTL